jgi:DNA polymerase I
VERYGLHLVILLEVTITGDESRHMPGPLDNTEVHLVETLDDLDRMRRWLGERREWLACDIETEGLNVGRDGIRLCQLGDRNHGWAIPWADWRGAVKDLLPIYDGNIVFHNALFDTRFLKRDGIVIPQHRVHDTYPMAHLVDPRSGVSLKGGGARYVDSRAYMGSSGLADAYKAGKWDWKTIPIDHPAFWVYSAMDTVLTALLAEELWPQIQPFRRVYEIEMAAIHVLRDAGLRGLAIDLDYTRRERAFLENRVEQLRAHLPFEPSKEAQVIEWLQSKGAVLVERTDAGNLSVDDDVLEEQEHTFPEVRTLRECRKRERMVNNYFKKFEDENVAGILYPSVKVLGARTARMSVTDPPLQTLPRGRMVRDCFVPRADARSLILADYDACELRVLASYAQERPMIEAFERGEDLHTWVASQAYEVPIGDVTKPQRQVSKNTQYARVYGAGNAKIALTAGVPVDVIDRFMVKYNELFPGVQDWMMETIAEVRSTSFKGDPKTGYVETILGRRLPVEKSKAFKGINYKIQSSATADLLKLKLVELAAAGLGEKILLPVHDEVVFEADDDEVDDVQAIIHDIFPEHRLFSCPIAIDVNVTKRWGTKYAGMDSPLFEELVV